MKMWILRSAIGNENVSPVCAKTEKKKKKTQINGQRGGATAPLSPPPAHILLLSLGRRSELVSHQPRANPKLKLHQEAITLASSG